jgi:hypothetical protein
MFDEKLYSLTVINAEDGIRRAETAINSANSNVVKWGHSMVQAFCRRAIAWHTIGVHVEIMGHGPTNLRFVRAVFAYTASKSIMLLATWMLTSSPPNSSFAKSSYITMRWCVRSAGFG